MHPQLSGKLLHDSNFYLHPSNFQPHVLIYDGICESLFEGRYLLYYGPFDLLSFSLCRDLKLFGDSCLNSRAGVDDVLSITVMRK